MPRNPFGTALFELLALRQETVVSCTEKKWQLGCATNQEKMSKHLSNSERLRILEEYFASDLSKYAIEKKHAQHERQEEGEPRPQSQAQGRETGPQSLQAPLVEPAEDTYGIEIQKNSAAK